MNDVREMELLEFVRKELSFHSLDLDTSLTTGKESTVQEDVIDLIERYAEQFGVDCSNLNWSKYFPQVGIPFLPNAMLPKFLKTDHNKPKPLTPRMLVESAKVGKWLYD